METQETKLLSGYSETEKGAYLAAMATVASADRSVSEEEIEFLNLLSEAAELSPAAREEVLVVARDPNKISVQKCLDVLKNSELRFSFITDVMSFAKADGQLDAEEEKKIEQMARYLNINQNQLVALGQFVNETQAATEQGQDPSEPGFLQKSGLGQKLGQSGIPVQGLMTGLLGIMAPLVISRMLSGGRRHSYGGGMGMGGGLLGGLLGSVMGGGMGRGGMMGGLGGHGGGMMGGGGMGGGLGSLMGVLGGLGGNKGYNRGGLGSILGSVLGGGKNRGW